MYCTTCMRIPGMFGAHSSGHVTAVYACRRLQQERKYKPGYCYHHLRARWGEEVLREFGISVDE